MKNIIVTFFAIPNGGTRNAIEMQNLKREGLVVGASDMVVVLFDKVLFIELKRDSKKAKVSKEQIAFIKRVSLSNVCESAICYGYDEAVNFIKENLCTQN